MIEIIECPPELFDIVYAEIQQGLNNFYQWQLDKLLNENNS